jgi:type II secretory pathway pseudopilin PulG
MNRVALPRAQRGVTLVIGLIMLVLITLIVTSAFILSGSNLKSVGNMQFRDEAVAAANRAIEQVLGSAFTAAPTGEDVPVDIDNDGTTDYVVHITQPQCIRATVDTFAPPSSSSLPASMSTASTWNTVWDVDATVTGSENAGGAQVHVRQGARVLLTQTQKDAVCP